MKEPFGLRLTPQRDWLELSKDYLQADKAWAVSALQGELEAYGLEAIFIAMTAIGAVRSQCRDPI